MKTNVGLIRSGMQLTSVILSLLPYGILLTAPYSVLNEVALTWGVITSIPTLILPGAAYYLAGDYSLILLTASAASASVGGLLLVKLHLASGLTVALAVLFYILYLITHFTLIRHREYPYFINGYPAKWATVGSLGGLLSKLILTLTYAALAVLAYSNPTPYVLAYLAAPMIGQALTLALAPKVSLIKPRNPSLTRGLKFTVTYHAGYAPMLVTYLALALLKPDWAGAFMIEMLPVSLTVTYIVSNAMWGDTGSSVRVITLMLVVELTLLVALMLLTQVTLPLLKVIGLTVIAQRLIELHGLIHYVHVSLLASAVTWVTWVIMIISTKHVARLLTSPSGSLTEDRH